MAERSNTLREINTNTLKIHGNSLEFGKLVVQLSNVSMFSTENVIPNTFPSQAILFIIGSLILFGIGSSFDSGFMAILGLGCLAYGIWMIYRWYQNRQEALQLIKLIIVTNSGNNFAIIFNNASFLNRVVEVLKEIIANPSQLRDVTINIRDNNFNDGSSVFNEFSDNSVG